MGVNVTVGETVLTMKGIDKSFPGVHALDHVDFDVRRGEVHALMGENGAGKSTLMKVLTGIYAKDEGTITYEGREVSFSNPREAQEAGSYLKFIAIKRPGRPEEIAALYAAYADPAMGYLTGADILCDVGCVASGAGPFSR